MYIIYVKFTIWIRVGKEMEEELNLFFGFLENDKKVSNEKEKKLRWLLFML